MQYTGKGYKGMTTVDGDGNTVNTDRGMIFWLSFWNMPFLQPILTPSDSCPCACHSENLLKRFMWKAPMKQLLLRKYLMKLKDLRKKEVRLRKTSMGISLEKVSHLVRMCGLLNADVHADMQ